MQETCEFHNIYIYIHTHTHTYIYIYTYIYMFACTYAQTILCYLAFLWHNTELRGYLPSYEAPAWPRRTRESLPTDRGVSVSCGRGLLHAAGLKGETLVITSAGNEYIMIILIT